LLIGQPSGDRDGSQGTRVAQLHQVQHRGGIASEGGKSPAGRRGQLREQADRLSGLGGRAFTSQFAGTEVELGGGFVHWFQPQVFAELTRYGIDFAVPPEPTRWSYISQGQVKHRLHALPSEKRAVADRGQASRGVKLWAHVRGDLEPFFFMAPDDHPIAFLVTETVLDSRKRLLRAGSR
jgi:hypothetical protein